jgi:hypothetical protein
MGDTSLLSVNDSNNSFLKSVDRDLIDGMVDKVVSDRTTFILTEDPETGILIKDC